MLNDEGVIVDDGAVVRVADDEFFVTVTSGNTGALERWMTWWLADWNLDVRLLNVTGAFAAVNLAGPASRDVMTAGHGRGRVGRRVAVPGVDAASMSPAFRRWCCASASWASWATRSTSRRCTASTCGPSSWQRGRATASQPFGLEAQRILAPGEAAHPDRPGHRRRIRPVRGGAGLDGQGGQGRLPRQAVARRPRRCRARRERLVGFTASGDWLPPEGASIVHDGTWVGRVTSARRSEAVGSIVGLAWVPAGWASEGTSFDIWFGDSTTPWHCRAAPVLRSRWPKAPIMRQRRP